MMPSPHLLQFFPPSASEYAQEIDWIFIVWCALAVCFTAVIAGSVIYFAIKYRRSQRPAPPPQVISSRMLEAVWIVIPLFINLGMFAWGADVFLRRTATPPVDAYEILVVGKQWMWKFEHPSGRRELDELHVPTGRPVRLIMISQDVIHDVFIPAFRLKHDVLPMKYSSYWFRATRPGTYHLFCAQYCGTNHSKMTGEVEVMTPEDFQAWLDHSPGMNSPASQGRALLDVLGCRACHRPDSLARAPMLEGLYGGPVALADGTVVTADDNYLRDSILDPPKDIVAHYQPVMPSYRGRVSEEEILQILAYLKSEPFQTERKEP